MKLFLNSVRRELQDKHLKEMGEKYWKTKYLAKKRGNIIYQKNRTQMTSFEYNNQLKVGSMCVG